MIVAKKDYVGIPTANWKFASFSKAEYETVLGKIKNGTVVVSDDITAAPTVTKTSVDYVSAFASK